jgi:hypothetical protein
MTAVTIQQSSHHFLPVLNDLSSRGVWAAVVMHGKEKLQRSKKNCS